METKDKLLILVIAAWIAAAVYFKVTTDSMFVRMDELEQLQINHVEKVNNEFRNNLSTLDLQFIGRGKHLRKAQNDIITNTQLIQFVTDSLSRNIETVQLNLEDFSRTADRKLSKIEEDITGIEDRFNSFRRRTQRGLDDLDQRLGTAEKDITDLDQRIPKTTTKKKKG